MIILHEAIDFDGFKRVGYVLKKTTLFILFQTIYFIVFCLIQLSQYLQNKLHLNIL